VKFIKAPYNSNYIMDTREGSKNRVVRCRHCNWFVSWNKVEINYKMSLHFYCYHCKKSFTKDYDVQNKKHI